MLERRALSPLANQRYPELEALTETNRARYVATMDWYNTYRLTWRAYRDATQIVPGMEGSNPQPRPDNIPSDNTTLDTTSPIRSLRVGFVPVSEGEIAFGYYRLNREGPAAFAQPRR